MNPHISQIKGREVLDSRGNPTVEVELSLSDGSLGRAIVPSGASTGEHETIELRDGDPKRYLGKGTLKSVNQINNGLRSTICGKNISDLRSLDRLMIDLDGTEQKSKLGGNTILGISLAFVNALSVSRKKPLWLVINELMGLTPQQASLPVPLMNILNGGMHANNGLEIQEFMIVPHGFDKFSTALRAGVEVFQHLKKILGSRNLSTGVGDEGGFAPDLKNNDEALAVICEAVEKAGYQLGKEISLALDVAASSFFDRKSGEYKIALDGGSSTNAEGLMAYYGRLLEKYPLVSIEDGLDENDWKGWEALTAKFGKRVQLVGDDLFVTQVKKVQEGIQRHCANAVLIKVNQVGSLTETFETMALCRSQNYNTVVSHRSGDTEDVTIAHLAAGSGSGQIKTGSASRSERTAKYNELLRIEEWAAEHGTPLKFKDPFSKR